MAKSGGERCRAPRKGVCNTAPDGTSTTGAGTQPDGRRRQKTAAGPRDVGGAKGGSRLHSIGPRRRVDAQSTMV